MGGAKWIKKVYIIPVSKMNKKKCNYTSLQRGGLLPGHNQPGPDQPEEYKSVTWNWTRPSPPVK